MASILDVAREAQVAPSTVSLVMNHRGRVSPETRDRVDEVIRRLGYRGRGNRAPKTADRAKALRFGFVYTPETLVDGLESKYCRELIRGAEQSLGGSASTLNIMRGQAHVDQDQMFIQHLEGRELDGLLMFGADPSDGYVDRVLQAGVPLVLFNRPLAYGRYSCVTVDFFGGSRQAIEHLLSLGHERIGLLFRTAPTRWPHELVFEGSMEALRARGMKPTVDLTLPLDWEPHHLDDACRRMMDAGVTAIQTGDMIAVPCIAALERMGLTVPDDVSVMGFDDRGRTTDSGLHLSTITYDRLRMGRMAGRMLQKLRLPNRGVSWLAGAVQTRLKSGQTTSPPKNRGSHHETWRRRN